MSSVILSPKLPSWFKQNIPDQHKIQAVKEILSDAHVATVCTSARCPNLGTCWKNRVATVMILGDICSRACRFCAVKTGDPLAVDPDEPEKVARVVRDLGLCFVVVTSVTRDDLSDGGAGHFAATIRAIRRLVPEVRIEILIPDFKGERESLETVIAAAPDVLAHNLETVARLSRAVRPAADYERSLAVLRLAKQLSPDLLTKSGIMVGMGETDAEITEAMADLRAEGCDILTIGQYLSPGEKARHVPVARFVGPEKFDEYRREALATGFRAVKSGPLVRSSFLAEEEYQNCLAPSSLG